MKFMFLKIISGFALATVIASVTQTAAFAQSAQKRQGIEGVWDVSVTIVQCDTGQAIGTGHAILMFSDGGSLTQILPTLCLVPVWARGVISGRKTIPQSTDSSNLWLMAVSPEPQSSRGT